MPPASKGINRINHVMPLNNLIAKPRMKNGSTV